MLTHSTPRRCWTAVAATVLAAIAIAAPASASVPYAPDRMNIPDNVLPAIQDGGINFTQPGVDRLNFTRTGP